MNEKNNISIYRLAPLLGFSLICLFTYLFSGAGDSELENIYFDNTSAINLPFVTPDRKYLLIIVGLLLLIGLFKKMKLNSLGLPSYRVYALFLLLMSISSVFDFGAAWSYSIGSMMALLFMYHIRSCNADEIRITLSVTAIFIAIFLAGKNYYYPPFDFSMLLRYGGGVNPNNHALYASFCLILSFLFLRHWLSALVLFVPIFSIALINVLLTASRTSILALLFAAFVIFWVRLNFKLFTITTTVLLIIGMIFVINIVPYDFFEHFILRSGSEYSRLDGTFIVPLTAFFDNHLIPYGPSVGEIVRLKYNSPLDSGYLWVALAGGVLPLSCLLAFIYLSFKHLIYIRMKIRKLDVDKNMICVAAAIVFYSFVFMIFEGGLRHILGWGDFIFLVAMFAFHSLNKYTVFNYKSVNAE